MTDLSPARKQIQAEEVKPNAAVSESLMTRLGQGINFINTRHVYQHSFHLNYEYNTEEVPSLGIDGYMTYPFPFRIIEVQVMSGSENGGAGFTELDLKWAADGDATYESIFTTTPKFTNAVQPNDTIRTGQTKTGWTAPVVTKTDFAAFDKIKLDLLNQLDGDVNGVFLKIFVIPI